MKANKALTVKQDVPSILATLDKELNSLKEITDKPYITTGVLTLGNTSIDIKTENNIGNLVKALSSVLAKEKAYQEAFKDLGLLIAPEFTQDGGNVKQWKEDIQKRLSVIQYEDRKNKLQGFKDKMSKFLSEEDQKRVLLKEMEEYLTK